MKSEIMSNSPHVYKIYRWNNIFIINTHGKFIRNNKVFLGWKINEAIGIGIVNLRAIKNIKKNIKLGNNE